MQREDEIRGSASSRYDRLFERDRVHRSVYTDPQIFEEEMRRIFGRTWVFVSHESEVPKPGDYKTDTIARQPIIVARHTDGEVYVHFNRCRHRGAKVCPLPYGTGSHFRCPYHGWTYRNNGELVSVPEREGFGPDFHLADYGLTRVPRVADYRGFIFASLNPDGPALDEHLGRAKHYIDLMVDRAPDGAIEAVRPLKYEYRGNWKLQPENYADNYHPPILHEAAFQVRSWERERAQKEALKRDLASGDDRYAERSLGRGHGVADFGPTARAFMGKGTYDDAEYLRALERRYGVEGGKQLAGLDIHVIIYPNLLLHHRLNHYRVIKPIAVDHTEVHTYPCRLKGAPTQVNDMLVGYTARHVSAMGEVQVDDMKIFEYIQEGLRAEAVEWVQFKLRRSERVNERGELECHEVSEMMQRGQYQEWCRLMAAG